MTRVRGPAHRKAMKVAEEKSCPNCGGELSVVPKGAYIKCVSCDWLGWSYEHVGAMS